MNKQSYASLVASCCGFLMFSTIAYADFNGFYIGGDLGITNFMTKESHSVNPESHQLGDIGIVGGAFVGYDFCLQNNMRLAVEGFINAADLNAEIEHAAFTYEMKQRYNFGVRLLPEYVLSEFMTGHFVLGYVNGQFRINDNGIYGVVNSSYHQSGLQLGAGLTTVLCDCLLVRVTALYNTYPSRTNRGTGLPNSGNPFQFYTNRFSDVTGEVALVYKF